jgi:hypothetical protein
MDYIDDSRMPQVRACERACVCVPVVVVLVLVVVLVVVHQRPLR